MIHCFIVKVFVRFENKKPLGCSKGSVVSYYELDHFGMEKGRFPEQFIPAADGCEMAFLEFE